MNINSSSTISISRLNFDEKSLNGIIRTALKLLENQGIRVCEHPMKEEIKLDVANYRVKKYKDKYITFCEKL